MWVEVCIWRQRNVQKWKKIILYGRLDAAIETNNNKHLDFSFYAPWSWNQLQSDSKLEHFD